jgi:hypothetical protein
MPETIALNWFYFLLAFKKFIYFVKLAGQRQVFLAVPAMESNFRFHGIKYIVNRRKKQEPGGY